MRDEKWLTTGLQLMTEQRFAEAVVAFDAARRLRPG